MNPCYRCLADRTKWRESLLSFPVGTAEPNNADSFARGSRLETFLRLMCGKANYMMSKSNLKLRVCEWFQDTFVCIMFKQEVTKDRAIQRTLLRTADATLYAIDSRMYEKYAVRTVQVNLEECSTPLEARRSLTMEAI